MPKIFDSGNCRIIAGIKLPDFFDSSSSKIKFSLKENLTYIFKDIILSGIMNQEKIKEYKNKLERERILLLAEIKRNETPVDFGSDTDDESDETENFGNQLAMIQGLKDRLNEIDIALNKIRSEGYGMCEKCGKEIEEAILDTDPESRYCKKCKLSEPRS